MTITMDQLTKAVNDWEALYKPADFLYSEHNVHLIRQALINRIKMGAPIDAEKVRDIVNRFLTQHESDGVRGMLELVNHTSGAPAPPSNPAHNLPDADEPLLKGLRCLEDIAEKGGEISKKVLSLGGGADTGGLRNVLLDKLNRRLAYIQEHRIKRADLPPEPQSQPQTQDSSTMYTPEQLEIRQRVAVIREQIERETTGTRTGYSGWAQKQNARLNRMLNELLREPNRQIFHDRSRGGVEVIRGLDAIERIMAEKIHDVVNGSISQ